MAEPKPLTLDDSVGTWLKHPRGGPVVRQLLAQAGVDERVLGPFRMFAVKRAVALSGGRVRPAMLDRLVAEVNGR
jgi:hypothetical protein